MICDLCSSLLAAHGAVPPHRALAPAGRATTLRPVLRRPVRVMRYRCGQCATNWLLDLDPSSADDGGWTWLGRAGSVLEPPSASWLGPDDAMHAAAPATAVKDCTEGPR